MTKLHKNHEYLPGTERYTQPEEIKALGKYLRNIREIQEEHTKLEEDNLMVPGDKNSNPPDNSLPKIPEELVTLPGQVLPVEGNIPDIPELKGSFVRLEGKTDIKLEDSRVTIEDQGEATLEDGRINITVQDRNSLEDKILNLSTGDDVALEDERLEISDSRENRLEETKLSLDSPVDTPLETYRENLKGSNENDLEDYKSGLPGNIDDPEKLEDTQVKINPQENINLGDTKITINKQPDISLEDEVKTIVSGENIELPESKVNIKPVEINSLETQSDKLNVTSRDLNLEDYRENLVSGKDNELETGKVTINHNPDISLDEKRISLEDKGENSLETEKINITSDISPNLDNSISDLPGEIKESSLETSKLQINPDRNISLEDESISLKKPDDVNLNDTREDLKGIQEITSLNDVQEKLGGTNRDIKLEERSETLSSSRDINNLDTTQITINPKENISLEETKVTINSQENNKLSEEKITISGGKEIPLSEKSETLQDTQKELTLENYLDDLIGGGDVNLEDKQEKLNDPRENNTLSEEKIERPGEELSAFLSDEVISLEKGKEISLGNHQETINDSRENSLENYLDDLIDTSSKNINLEDKIINLDSPEDNKLEDELISLAAPENNELEDKRLEIEDDSKFSFPGSSILLDVPEDNKLGDKRLEIEDDSEVSFPGSSILLDVQDDNKLEKKKLKIKDDRDLHALSSSLRFKDIPLKVEDDNELEDKKLEIKDDRDLHSLSSSLRFKDIPLKVEDDNELEDKRLEIEDNREISRPTDTISLSIPGKYKIKKYEDDPKEIIPTNTNSKNKPNTTLKKIPQSEQEKKVEKLNDGKKKMPKYKLPSMNLGSFLFGNGLNPSTYLRWAAENTVGKIPLKGSVKQKLIDETLHFLVWGREALEKLTKSNRDRLPGDSSNLLSAALKGDVKSLAAEGLKSIFKNKGKDRSKPINRPSIKKGKTDPEQKSWEVAGDQVFLDSKNPNLRSFTDYINESYKIGGDELGIGIGITLQELINTKGHDITDLEGFKTALKDSKFITTPEKFTTTKYTTNYMTLDSNHIWEISIRPYAGVHNGYLTWLPSFLEIDFQNKQAFNYSTRYSYGWLPITGFELQEKKLTSKDLPLYDGSISYPVSMEFTNEIRLTFADDSLKSLKRYFDTCAKVSAYMSNIHNPYLNIRSEITQKDNVDLKSSLYDYNIDEVDEIVNPTVYLDRKIHPGLYKNLSFLITLFILTPQYGTIKKCNLLCVLKDYTIENQGEIDSSPTELNVTFSIVGENPKDGIDLEKTKESYTPPPKTGNKDRPDIDVIGNIIDGVFSIF